MRVMVIVKATKDSEAGIMPNQKLIEDMGKFNEQLVKAGIMLADDADDFVRRLYQSPHDIVQRARRMVAAP